MEYAVGNLVGLGMCGSCLVSVGDVTAPGLWSVGWHWDKCPFQGPKGGTQTVNLLPDAWMGVAPSRSLGGALPCHWVGSKVGGTFQVVAEGAGTESKHCFKVHNQD